jgi:hypothetical protein
MIVSSGRRGGRIVRENPVHGVVEVDEGGRADALVRGPRLRN